jgi:hypothetical protein
LAISGVAIRGGWDARSERASHEMPRVLIVTASCADLVLQEPFVLGFSLFALAVSLRTYTRICVQVCSLRNGQAPGYKKGMVIWDKVWILFVLFEFVFEPPTMHPWIDILFIDVK